MEKPVETREESFRKEAQLLEELVRCLSEERENLIHLDTERLWTLVERKEEILLSLQEIRKDRKETENKECAEGRPPVGYGRHFMKPAPRIALLREEIKARVKENSAFIQEILSFIDQLFRGLASLGRPEPVYSPVRNAMREVSSSLFHKEV